MWVLGKPSGLSRACRCWRWAGREGNSRERCWIEWPCLWSPRSFLVKRNFGVWPVKDSPVSHFCPAGVRNCYFCSLRVPKTIGDMQLYSFLIPFLLFFFNFTVNQVFRILPQEDRIFFFLLGPTIILSTVKVLFWWWSCVLAQKVRFSPKFRPVPDHLLHIFRAGRAALLCMPEHVTWMFI